MQLADVPLLLALAGLTLYAVLGGADFGAGFWQLVPGRGGERAERLRDLSHDAMAPVWEANHVWLIFVLVVMWTAYPTAFASIASTLAVPLFAAAVGIVFRGTTYALRTGAAGRRELRGIDAVFGVSSVLTPFALGTVVGAIAAGRVPVGNAAGGIWTSWTGAVPLTIGALAVVTGAYLAAVYLAADAMRRGEPDLAATFRTRALGAGVVGGAAAVAGLVVLHADAHGLYRELVAGDALAALIASGVAGLATLALVARRRFEAARYAAASAVAAVVAGWALAQSPRLLPGLSVAQAAAPRSTLIAVVVAILAGLVVLAPALVLLFRLTLGGRLGAGWSGDGDEAGAAAVERRGAGVVAEPEAASTTRALGGSRAGPTARLAIAFLIAAIGFLTIADAGWAHAIGVAAVLGFVATGFLASVPGQAGEPVGGASRPPSGSRKT